MSLVPRDQLAEKVRDRPCTDREPLDPLCSPLGADLSARHAPDLLRVRLEEGPVQLPAEAVDEELLEGSLVADREENRAEVGDSDPHRTDQTELDAGCPSDSEIG